MKEIKRERKPGEAPLHRVPIFDHKGHERGHVGQTATAATVARFIGPHGSKLTKKNGRPAWVGDKPPVPPKPKFPPKPQSGAQPNEPNNAKSGASQSIEISLKAAKGSTTDKPGKPDTRARPKR